MNDGPVAFAGPNGAQTISSEVAVRSVPALAARMRQIDRCALPASYTQIFNIRSLSPA